ncbi:helix-turn-helix domain-containing protein [Fulvivirga lutimaris]|uniref:helix-turn-helix domain-containing protein n=1 Tax=Fulvivirga lutimaris TaxID=1819566 RepID=UPI0012BB99E6|nr:AraC family transcriptional regulator [Fulvivirga lutimaris]MTI38062.1 AraC family transcriptional regulator [Fulvivirga lutimaris]
MVAHNFIIHQQARQYQWSGECFLSIKSFYNGSARYNIKQREYRVTEHNYLILNDCTKYNLTIDHSSSVESFCVFFSPEFVNQLASEWKSTEEQLLDFTSKKEHGLRLLERNYIHGGQVSNLLQAGRNMTKHTSKLAREEYYYALLNAIVLQNSSALAAANNLPSKKKATREEIYRRVLYAKDFIDAHYSENLTLKEIARVAMLSENHLLRNFNRIFLISPFQYITRLKVNAAKQQITETDQSISDIAMGLGYSSLGNFSNYFKSIVGQSPLALRKKGDI